MVLLRRGANIECRTLFDETPLHHAAVQGRLHIVEALLSEGANIEATNKDGRTALHLASRNHQVDAVAALLKRDACVDVVDREGMAPLHLAVMENDKDVVLALVNGGSDLIARNGYGLTALQLAMSLGRGGECEKVLITAELERFRSLPLSQGDASKVLEFESVANNVQNRISLLTALLYQPGGEAKFDGPKCTNKHSDR